MRVIVIFKALTCEIYNNIWFKLQLKEFLKKCKVGNFTKQIKQIVDKVDENSKFITARRRTANISLTDDKAIVRMRIQSKEQRIGHDFYLCILHNKWST